MIYNAEGELLHPFVVHKGDIPKGVQEYFKDEIGFAETIDGDLNQTTLMNICQYIERFECIFNNKIIHLPCNLYTCVKV